jgi:HlyD family secretion protein
MFKKLLPFILVAAIAYAAYYNYQGHHFTYAGTIESDETDISPGVTSEIGEYLVKEGDSVKAGQLLVSLECQEVRINAANVKNDYTRGQRLYTAGSMPKAEFDKLSYSNQNANLQLSFCDIVAPTDGTVLSVYHRKGEWVRPGENLLTMADEVHVYCFIYVPKTELVKLKPGMALTASVPEANKTYNGTIAFIRPEAEFTPKNVQTREERDRLVFGVKVAFDNSDGGLNPGLPVEVSLPN